MRNCKLIVVISWLLIAGIALVSCSGSPTTRSRAASAGNPEVTGVEQSDAVTPQLDPLEEAVEKSISDTPQAVLEAAWPEGQRQRDGQGAVEVEVIPLNLNDYRETLDFEVSLNTHSVDLSMDLATLATLAADNGREVQASLWDAPRGGHHVSGKLSFPASVDGSPLLEGATMLTLTLTNLDAPQRVFVWER